MMSFHISILLVIATMHGSITVVFTTIIHDPMHTTTPLLQTYLSTGSHQKLRPAAFLGRRKDKTSKTFTWTSSRGSVPQNCPGFSVNGRKQFAAKHRKFSLCLQAGTQHDTIEWKCTSFEFEPRRLPILSTITSTRPPQLPPHQVSQ